MSSPVASSNSPRIGANPSRLSQAPSFEHELKETSEDIPPETSSEVASHMYQYYWSTTANSSQHIQKEAKQRESWLHREQAKGYKMMSRVFTLEKNDPTLPEGISQLNTCPPPTRKNPQFLLSGYLAVKTATSWTSRWTCRYVVLTPHFLYVFKRTPPTPGQHAHSQITQVTNAATNGSELGINQSVSSIANDVFISHPSHEQHSALEIFGEIRDKIPIDSSLAVIDAGGLFFQLSHPNKLRLVFRALNPRHTAIWKGAIRTSILLCSHSIQTLLGSLPQTIALQQQQAFAQAQTQKRKSVPGNSNLVDVASSSSATPGTAFIPAAIAGKDASNVHTTSSKDTLLQGVLSSPSFGIIPHVNQLIPAYTDRSCLISSISLSFGQITPAELAGCGLLASPLTLVTSQNRDPGCYYPEVVLERNINWGEEVIVPFPQSVLDKVSRGATTGPHLLNMTMQDGATLSLDLVSLYNRAVSAAVSHCKGSSAERNASVNSNFSFADGSFPLENSFYDADIHAAWRFVAGKSKEETETSSSPKRFDSSTTLAGSSATQTVSDPTSTIPVMFKHVKRTGNMLKTELSLEGLLVLLAGIAFAFALNTTLRDSVPDGAELLLQTQEALQLSFADAFKTLSPVLTLVLGSLLAGIAVIYGASLTFQTVLNPYAKRPNKYLPAAGTHLATVTSVSSSAPPVVTAAAAPAPVNARDWKESRVPLHSLPHLRMVFVRMVDVQSPTGPVLLNGVPFQNSSWPVLPSSEGIPTATRAQAAHGAAEDATAEPVASSTVVRHSIPVRRRRIQITDMTFGDSASLDLSQFVQDDASDDVFPTYSDDDDEDDEEEDDEEVSLDRFNSSPSAEANAEKDPNAAYEKDPELGRIVPSIWGKWCQASHEALKLRGPDYLTNKKKPKIPATQHRFEAAYCDIIAVVNSFNHASSRPDSFFEKEKAAAAAKGLGHLWAKGTPLKFLCTNWIVPGEPNYNFICSFRNPYVHPWPYSDSPSTPHAIATQKLIKDTIAQGEEAIKAKFTVVGNDQCKAYYPKEDPFFTLMQKFVDGDNEFRTSRFKYIPNIVVGSWVVKKGVGQTPVILGNKLAQNYYEDENRQYIEVEIDVSTSSVAGSVLKLVKSSAKSLEIDQHFLLEPHADDELPEALWSGIRIKNVDLFAIPTTHYDDE